MTPVSASEAQGRAAIEVLADRVERDEHGQPAGQLLARRHERMWTAAAPMTTKKTASGKRRRRANGSVSSSSSAIVIGPARRWVRTR